MTDQEKKEVMARLAARDAATLSAMGISGTADADKITAMSRLIGELNIPIMQVGQVYKNLLAHLQGADLTINFCAYKFFNSAPQGAGYVSQFEGGNKWGGGTYITTRDEVEEGMFDYGKNKPVVTPPHTKTQTASIPVQVLQRITNLGKLSSPEFEPSVRPKYAALNYAKLRYGAAGQWGKSYIVLKEYVKHNCSFIHTDSFDEWNNRAKISGQVASFIDMHRLIVNMPANMLTSLYEVAINNKTYGMDVKVPGMGDTQYIEAHLHGEIRFDRDVAKIVINQTEVQESLVKTQNLVNSGKPFKERTPEKIQKIFRKFANKNGIQLIEQN
jgi:Protein of unknown function (DUF3626)